MKTKVPPISELKKIDEACRTNTKTGRRMAVISDWGTPDELHLKESQYWFYFQVCLQDWFGKQGSEND